MTTTAEQARDVVLDAVAETHTPALGRALDVITAWAATGRPFSANDCRADMDAASVPTPVRGRAFMDARRRGVIRPVGAETSTDRRTHAKPVARYVSTDVPEAPQGRTPRGRFDTPVHEDQQALAI